VQRLERGQGTAISDTSTFYSEVNGYFIPDYVAANMNHPKLILKDTVVGQLWQGVSFYRNVGRTRLMSKAFASSAIRNFVILGILWITYQSSI
jgi:hypothetical protein